MGVSRRASLSVGESGTAVHSTAFSHASGTYARIAFNVYAKTVIATITKAISAGSITVGFAQCRGMQGTASPSGELNLQLEIDGVVVAQSAAFSSTLCTNKAIVGYKVCSGSVVVNAQLINISTGGLLYMFGANTTSTGASGAVGVMEIEG